MLTQFELLSAAGGLGVDDDGGMTVSPLEGLAEYPMEQAEFEYIETSLPTDAYYDMPQPSQDLRASLALSPSPAPATPFNTSLYDTSSYDSTTIIYDQDNIAHFASEVTPLTGSLKSPQEIKQYEDEIKSVQEELKFDEDMSSYDGFPGTLYDSSPSTSDVHNDTISLGSLCDTLDPEHHVTSREEPTPKAWEEGTGKGKIGPLQRRALDSIFSVTEKPSRGLVLHIASELGLHHLTVKNFFSNGRRRLRRAAARLSDPERTKRENERRKEKRRLAALASAALAGGEGKGGGGVGAGATSSIKVMAPHSPPADSSTTKDTPVVSPERKALMEKLADKVQRSVAQRSLAADPDLLLPSSTATLLSHTSHNFFSQPSHDILAQPPSDILPQSSHDILANSATSILTQSSHDILTHTTHDLLTHSPHDFLAEPTQDLQDSSSTPLLQPHIDPWNLF